MAISIDSKVVGGARYSEVKGRNHAIGGVNTPRKLPNEPLNERQIKGIFDMHGGDMFALTRAIERYHGIGIEGN